MQQHFLYERSRVYQLDVEHLRVARDNAALIDWRHVSILYCPEIEAKFNFTTSM